MNGATQSRIANGVLRALSTAGKFVLLVALARFVEPSVVGLYGLITATLAYGVVLLGLDFYTYANREMLSTPRERWSTILRDQTRLYLVGYSIGLPLTMALFGFGLLPWRVAGWFVGLLVAEHIAAEINRVLITIGRPIYANAVLFIRSGAWPIIVAAGMIVFEGWRQLELVLFAWLIGAVSASMVGVVGIRAVIPGWEPRAEVGWRWIARGIRIGLVFLAATALIRGMLTVDRYLVEWASNPDVLGAYTFYASLAFSIVAFLESGVFVFLYPDLVSAFRGQRYGRFRSVHRRLWLEGSIVALALGVGVAVAVFPVLGVIDQAIYASQIHLLWWLVASSVAYGVSMIPHYGLYAFGRDGTILMAQLAGFVVFLGLSLWFGHRVGAEGVAIGMFGGFSVVLAAKSAGLMFWYPRLMRADE